MSAAAYADAVDRFVAALNAPNDEATLALAFDPGAVIERMGFGHNTGQLMERIEGTEAIGAWLRMTNDAISFFRAGDVSPPAGDEPATTRYGFRYPGYEAGGEWRLRLAPDGRIAWLRHTPDNIVDGSTHEEPLRGGDHDPGHDH